MRPVTTTTPSRLLAVAVVAVCACVNIAFVLWVLLARPALNSDFRGIWSFAAFARLHAGQIYQAAPLQAFQQQIYPGFHSFFPYQYPPSFLLPSLWLGDFGFATAEAIWTLAGIAVLMVAGCMFFRRPVRWFAIAALLASPASLLNGAAGETGYFSTALLLAGFALLPARPWAAGIAFGLLTLKPQLALLVPVALLARAEWRAGSAACLTALTLAALSCAWFPPLLWLDWLRSLTVYQAHYLAAGKTLNLHMLVTPLGNLVAAGAAPRLAWSLQAMASVLSAAAVFLAFRQGTQPVAALFTAMFLCAPHAYAYDTLPLIAAMLMLAPASVAGVTGCALVYLAPDLLLSGHGGWLIYTVPEALLLISFIYLAIGRTPRPNASYEPVSSTRSRPGQC